MRLSQDIVEYYGLFTLHQFNVVFNCLQQEDGEILRACGKPETDEPVEYDVIEYICANLKMPEETFISVNNQILKAWKILSIPSMTSVDTAYDIFLKSFLLVEDQDSKVTAEI
jgi:hypothetical protein